MRAIKSKLFDILSKYEVIIFALILLVYNTSFFSRYFPFSEGWWQTYGYLIRKGYVPYKDFNASFPPMFMFINSILPEYIVNNFLLNRFVGVVLCSATMLLLYSVIKSMFNKSAACYAVFYSMILNISAPVFIANDYHMYMNFFIALSLLLLIRNNNYIISVLLGMSLSITTLIKQNVGVMLLVAILFSVILASDRRRNGLVKCLWIMVGFIVMIVAVLYALNINIDNSFLGIFTNNDSKGSLLKVLTRLFTDSSNKKIVFDSLIIAAVIGTIGKLVNKYYVSKRNVFDKDDLVSNGVKIALLVAVIVCVFAKNIIIMLSIGIVISFIFSEVRQAVKSNATLLLVPLLSLAYANTQTALICYDGVFFLIAVSYAMLFSLSIDYLGGSIVRIKSILVIAILGFTLYMATDKYKNPYDWWGITQSSIFDAKSKINYSQLRGFTVDQKTARMFNRTKEIIDRYSTSSNDLYLYPNIPIFYYLHNKIPPYSNLIQWYDVITYKKTNEELSDFRLNPPKLLVFIDVPKKVIYGHYNLIGRELVQEKITELVNEMQLSGKFKQVDCQIYSNDYMLGTSEGTNINVRELVVSNQNLKLVKYSNLGSFVGNNNYKIIKLYRKNIPADPTDTYIQIGDKISVEIRNDELEAFVKQVGFLENGKVYVVRYLVRED